MRDRLATRSHSVFEHRRRRLFLRDLMMREIELDARYAGLFGDVIERQDGEAHGRHAEEVHDTDHLMFS